MEKDHVRDLIEGLYDSVVADTEARHEVNYLLQETCLTRRQIIDAWIFWDTGIREYTNEVYSSDAVRIAMHMHNMLPGNWHEKRQQKVSGYMDAIRPASVCEIGFGTPQKYVKKLLEEKHADVLLADFDETSIHFAGILLKYWQPVCGQMVSLQMFDMNRDVLPAGYDTYVFQDSIEHAIDPTTTLHASVGAADPQSHFIFSLPIEVENPIPEHFIFWKNREEVLRWVENAGLNIKDDMEIPMNKELDIYASSLHPDFKEIVILAQK